MKIHYVDFWEFTAIMKDLDIDTKHMSALLYDQKFGCIARIFCCPCKSLCKKIRNNTIKNALLLERCKLANE